MASDVHEGSTGVEIKDNIYRLELKKYRTNLDSYIPVSYTHLFTPHDGNQGFIGRAFQCLGPGAGAQETVKGHMRVCVCLLYTSRCV